jgi:serine/threonine protein kinase
MLINIENLNSNYKVDRKLGSGGMGDVYLALDKRLDRYVAIKMLKFSNISLDERDEFVLRFKTEAKAIARLSHQNIVGIYDIGNENSNYYMIMEYLEGSNLNDLIKNSKQRIPLNLVASIGFQIASALEYAHENNIIHRDIKPENVILSKKGIVKVTDFGIAKLGQDKSKIMDESVPIMGSVLYSSPEQIKNSLNVDYSTDIYSLGITLYELISGQPPFANSKEIRESIEKIFTEKPQSLITYYPDIPEKFQDIIFKCLEKDPKNRFENARELKNALSTFLQSEALNDLSISNLTSISDSINNTNSITSIKSNNTISKSFMLKNRVFEDGTTKLTKILGDDIEHISKINDKIKNYSWIKDILNKCEIKTLKIDSPKIILDEVTQKSNLGQSFTGVVIIDDYFYVFVYESILIGSLLDLDSKKLIGDKAIESLPDMCEKVEVISTQNNYLYYPVLIYNLIVSGLELYKDIDKNNTDIDFLFERISSSDEDFTGLVEAEIVDKSSKIEILHIEDDKVSEVVISNSIKKIPFLTQYTNAESIEEAQKIIQDKKFDFIILDIFLRDGNAIDFIDTIKKYQTAPILVTTTSEDPNLAISIMKKASNEMGSQLIDYKIKRPDTAYFDEINTLISEQILISEQKENNSSTEKGKEVFYFAFAKGEHLFSLKANIDNNVISIINEDIKTIRRKYDLKLNLFKYKIDFLNFNMNNLISKMDIKKEYKNSINIILDSILENKTKITQETLKALEDNISLELNTDLKIKILDSEFNLERNIKNSQYYQFSNWIIKNLFASLHNKEQNRDSFENMYSSINNIDKINLFNSLSGSDNKMHKFQCVFKNKNGELLFIAKFGGSTASKIEEFIQEAIHIKKNNKSLKGIFYISKDDYYPSDLDIVKKYTKTSGFSFFDKLAKFKSIVRIENNEFFHLNLLQYDKSMRTFDVIYPVI